MPNLTPWLDQRFFLADGVTPNAGGKVFTYYPGTSTKKSTFAGESAALNTNPIILDSTGRCNLWLDAGGYKIINAPANDTDPPAAAIKTWDNINVSGTLGDPVGIASSVAELKALAEGAFETVQTLGYYSANGVGAGLYYWDATNSSADNGGTVIAPTISDGTGRWILILGDVIRASQFGATEDGVTDDSAALQRCMNWVRDSFDLGGGEGITIQLTGGYKCNFGLIVPTRVDLFGKTHSAGNLNRNTARLDFTSLGINTKAITIGSDSTLEGIVISGPGLGVSGTYGIYGGLVYTENYGIHNRFIDVTLEGFETDAIISGWLNIFSRCNFGSAKYGLVLQDAANGTIVNKCGIGVGNGGGQIGIYIKYGTGRSPEGIYITESALESNYQHIVVEAGKGIVIAHDRFELTNLGFVEVRGRNAASDADLSVDIHHNYMLDYGANASGSSRFGVMYSAGKCTIDNNVIDRYDAGTNVGLTYGITFGGTGVMYGCLIGKNRINAYSPFPNSTLTYATRKYITSRFSRVINYTWDTADNPNDNVETYFRFNAPDGYSAVYSLRSFSAFNIDDILDASAATTAIGEIDIGYRSGTPNLTAYMDNFALTNSNANTVTYATDTEWTTTGKTLFGASDARAYLIRMEPGNARSGRIVLTLIIDEFQY